MYGPVFTFAAEAVALAAGTSSDLAFWIFRSLAALAVLATTGLAAFLARRRAFACAFVGWNPLVALHFAGGGHNDSWMMAFVMAALAAGAVGRRQWAGVAWVLAVLVKWIPLLFLPLRALQRGRRAAASGISASRRPRSRSPPSRSGSSVGTGSVLRGHSRRTPRARRASRSRTASKTSGSRNRSRPGIVAAGFAIGYVWLAREAWRGRARLGLTACFVLLATPYLAPWYVIWALPLAVVEEDRTAQVIILVLCAYLVPMGVPLDPR